MSDVPELPGPDAPAFWNGEPCEARQVIVTVADDPEAQLYWARPFVGTDREAVEVTYAGGTFYLDDEGYEQSPETIEYLEGMARARVDALGGRTTTLEEQRRQLGADNSRVGGPGHGWAKVTLGHGSPRFGHSSLAIVPGSVRERVAA